MLNPAPENPNDDFELTRPKAGGPLLQNILGIPGVDDLAAATFGRVCKGILLNGGKLTFQNSDSGPSYIEIEYGGETTRICPMVGADAEDEALFQLRSRQFNLQPDSEEDPARIGIDTLRVLVHRESQTRES